MAADMAKSGDSSAALFDAESFRPPSPRRGAVTRVRTVRLVPLKEFARKLRPDHPLRIVLVEEPDEMDAAEFCVKVSVWLRLL
jgi:hypothetical protein